MQTAEWIALGVGVIGVVGGFGGQAMFWGVFKGRVISRLDGHDQELQELKHSKAEQWAEINAQGNRITKIEAVCEVRHGIDRPNGRAHV